MTAKARPGPRPSPDARRVPCQTRLSEAEHAAATAAAQAAGLTLSEWVRGAVLGRLTTTARGRST
jgi:hypothetical protein